MIIDYDQYTPQPPSTTIKTPAMEHSYYVQYQNSLDKRERCECHDCTQARWKMSNPLAAALNNG
jgi:predicted metal-dependent hydrolase